MKKDKRKIPEMKPLFKKRMQELLGKDFKAYEEILKQEPVRSIRCNTLKISPEKLLSKLKEKGWQVSQPWKNNPEIIIIKGKISPVSSQTKSRLFTKEVINKKSSHTNKISAKDSSEAESEANKSRASTSLIELEPGELGRSLEHLLGYYYIQELASMLPPIALNPQPGEKILDMCAAPGSKTTQIAAMMQNTGTIIANEISMGRLKILASNTERCGVTNTIISKKDGIALCKKFSNIKFKFDKILLDAPCSGEGTLRSSYKTYLMWNPKTIFYLSRLQKQMIKASWEILKTGGELLYSTCTHAPEENEAVVDFFLKEFKDKVQIEKINLPINTRPGITRWNPPKAVDSIQPDKDFSSGGSNDFAFGRETKQEGRSEVERLGSRAEMGKKKLGSAEKYLEEVKNSCRIYPQDNNTEGFFLAKFKKLN